jgi:uncharacterized protein YgiM (DUF1202 family)
VPSIRPNFSRINTSTFKGWGFVLVAGVALAIIAVIDRGGMDALGATADGSTGCRLEVSADRLNVRSAPGEQSPQVETLPRGEQVDATPTVTDGFRELENGNWAADRFLTPLPGADCS